VHGLVPSGIKLETTEDFNQDFGGVDDMQSNLTRYGIMSCNKEYGVSALLTWFYRVF